MGIDIYNARRRVIIRIYTKCHGSTKRILFLREVTEEFMEVMRLKLDKEPFTT